MGKEMKVYLVNSVTHKQTKGGKAYMTLQVFEKGGRAWQAMCWEDKPELKSGQVIDAMVEVTEYQGTEQLTIHALRVIITTEALDDFLPKTACSIPGLSEELQKFVAGVSNPHLRALLAVATSDPRWKRAPAAKSMHHAYLGGLLEHTVNLCRLANAVAGLYADVRRDYLITGAILHDIGKMDEMDSGVTIEYTTIGELIGHIGIGLLRVDHLMDANPDGFGTHDKPTELRNIVRHIIASHHGSPQYGALKSPATLEAQIFSNLDGIDANVGKIRACIEKAAGKEWTDKVNWETPRIYVGKPEAR